MLHVMYDEYKDLYYKHIYPDLKGVIASAALPSFRNRLTNQLLSDVPLVNITPPV